jgi:NAD(P)-dependent dehydrogenase (short-subunit alcohol dehydrogenase family)
VTRVVAVTGSASGIGAATRKVLEEAGHRVVGVDLHDADVIADLASPGGRSEAVAGVRVAAGGPLDGFVGYAGVGPTIPDITLLTTVNFFGQFDLIEGLRSALMAGTDPSVVIVSSIAGMIAEVDDPSVDAMVAGDEDLAVEYTVKHGNPGVAYSSSKLAAARAGRRRAVAWVADGIRVNVLAPGNTVTPMTDAALADDEVGPLMRAIPVPLGRWAQPAEIADAAAWLLTGASRYLIGSVLVVDGGIHALLNADGV